MRLASAASLAALTLALASPSLALPPGAGARGLREGANHRLGDDSFLARFGRTPGAADREHLRMQTHLRHVHAWLSSRPPTRPDLASRRNELLGYLAQYTDKGITPRNLHIPWRNPVFIDDDGNVCAVGYLIERTAGRPVAERIARDHRHDLLEDIAAAMPIVRAWIDASGFTVEELASIQPGYVAPVVESYKPWDLAAAPPKDGAFASDDGTTRGAFARGSMEGKWTRTDAAGKLAGSGEMTRGRGTWRSVYPDGSAMASGPFERNRPHGEWTFHHPGGNVAAVGRFENGLRSGAWTFYHDTKVPTPIATGSFAHGSIVGTWRHHDAEGRLVAISQGATPSHWEGSSAYLLDVLPDASGIHHWVHQGNLQGDHHRLDAFYDGSEHVYARFGTDDVYDADGNRLARNEGGGWTASACNWSVSRKAAARAGDVVTLHGLLRRDRFESKEKCGAGQPVSAARAKRISAMLAPLTSVRSASPAFLQRLVLGDMPTDDADDADARAKATAADLAKILAANMTWYVEWPHVDGRFVAVFQTLPGYSIQDA